MRIAFAIFMFLSTSVHAEDSITYFQDGNQWKHLCDGGDTEQLVCLEVAALTSDALLVGNRYGSYSAAEQIWNEKNGRPKEVEQMKTQFLWIMPHTASQPFCRPPTATAVQIKDIVYRYLSDHPEKRTDPFSSLELMALEEAFPCAK